jgi:hypothetical protein
MVKHSSHRIAGRSGCSAVGGIAGITAMAGVRVTVAVGVRGIAGITAVTDYVAGELDWLAAGLPTEGRNAELPRAGDVARPDAPTCRLDEPIGQVRERVRAAGWDACVVVNDQ